MDRSIEDLSGGELQRFACAMVCIQNGDIFMFDEPSSYLDVKQRLKAAVTIRSLIEADKLVLFLDMDLCDCSSINNVFPWIHFQIRYSR